MSGPEEGSSPPAPGISKNPLGGLLLSSMGRPEDASSGDSSTASADGGERLPGSVSGSVSFFCSPTRPRSSLALPAGGANGGRRVSLARTPAPSYVKARHSSMASNHLSISPAARRQSSASGIAASGYLSAKRLSRADSAAFSTPGGDKDAKQYKKGELLSSTVVTHLVTSVKTSRQRGELVVHCFLVTTLCVMLLLSRVEGNASTPYFVFRSVKDMAVGKTPGQSIPADTPKSWDEVSDEASYWSWLGGFVDRIWHPDDPLAAQGAQRELNVPLSFVVLYQQRLRTSPCDPGALEEANLLSSLSRAMLPGTCSDSFGGSAATLDDRPYGRNASFKSNAQLAAEGGVAVVGLSETVRGNLFPYSSGHGRIYVEILNLTSPAADVKNRLKELEEAGWYDAYTRLVGVDYFTLNRMERYFVRCQLFAEVTGGGEVLPQSYFLPFTIVASALDTGRDVLVLVLDCFIISLAGVELVNLITSLQSNAQLEGDWRRAFSAWECINAVNMAFFIVSYYYRFALLAITERPATYVDKAGGGGQASELFMYETLASFASMYSLNIMYQSWNVSLTWLRLFQYLQYNQRLNVVMETIKQAAGELLAMTVIASIITMSYAFMGHLLFGPSCSAFRDFSRSFGTLLGFIYGDGAYSGNYTDMAHAHPVLAPVYVLSFLIIIWLILLNLVLAIITGSFAMVQESLAEPDWSMEGIVDDLKASLRDARRFFAAKWKWLTRASKKRPAQPPTAAQKPYLLDEGVCGGGPGPKKDGPAEPGNEGSQAEADADERQTGGGEQRAAVDNEGIYWSDGESSSSAEDGSSTESQAERRRNRRKLSTDESVQLIRLLRAAQADSGAQYVTEEEMLALAPFLSEKQCAEVLAQARKQFSGKQQLLKMGERLAQHMSMRLIDIEEQVERLVSLEPFIAQGIPQLDMHVTEGFDNLTGAVVPNIDDIKSELQRLAEIQDNVGVVQDGMGTMALKNASLSSTVQKVSASLTEQAKTLVDIIRCVNHLQSIPEAQDQLLVCLKEAGDAQKKTTEQLLVPLKTGLGDLLRQTKVRSDVSLSSALYAKKEKETTQQQEKEELEQYYSSMVGDVLGVQSSGDSDKLVAAQATSRSASRASEVLSEIRQHPTGRLPPLDMYEPADHPKT